MKTTLLLDQQRHPQGHLVRALLKIECEAPTNANRTPLNISIVLDRSGSMNQRAYDSTRALRSKTQHIARTRRKTPETEA